jgi:hypothetical protein
MRSGVKENNIMNNTMKLNIDGKFEAIDPTDVGVVWWVDILNKISENMSPQNALEHRNVTLAKFPDEFVQANNDGFNYFASLLALGIPLREATSKASDFARKRAEQLIVVARVTREGIDAHALFSAQIKVAQSQRIDRVDSIRG